MPPSPNGCNGRMTLAGTGARDGQGRFAKGNAGGPGNPFARRVAKLRRVMLDAVSGDDLRAIVAKLVEQAKAGDVVAAREVLNRITGKPMQGTDPDRLDVDDAAIERELLEHRRAVGIGCDEPDPTTGLSAEGEDIGMGREADDLGDGRSQLG